VKSYLSSLDLINDTPLIELKSIEEKYHLKSKLLAKIEMFNLGSSIKARIAKYMVLESLKKGIINKKTVIVEPTSGNTGIALAMILAILKMNFIAVMPENFSKERQKLIKAYGGKVILTSKKDGMNGAINKVQEILKKNKNSYSFSQFDNELNWKTHYLYTGPEIYKQTDKNVDVFISGIGTGGTITGVAKYLKLQKDIKVIGVEPLSSPLINKGYASSHAIQGIGANFIPKILDLKYVDEVKMVSDDDAFKYARILAKEEGLFVGISSGACLCAALDIAKENEGKCIVMILPDSGERYLSTELVPDE